MKVVDQVTVSLLQQTPTNGYSCRPPPGPVTRPVILSPRARGPAPMPCLWPYPWTAAAGLVFLVGRPALLRHAPSSSSTSRGVLPKTCSIMMCVTLRTALIVQACSHGIYIRGASSMPDSAPGWRPGRRQGTAGGQRGSGTCHATLAP